MLLRSPGKQEVLLKRRQRHLLSEKLTSGLSTLALNILGFAAVFVAAIERLTDHEKHFFNFICLEEKIMVDISRNHQSMTITMLLTSSDNQITRQITLVYCISSCVVLPLAALISHWTGGMLIAGSTKAIPLFIPLILFELVKWSAHHIIYDKDLKLKKTNRFGNMSIIYRHIDIIEALKGIVIYSAGAIVFFVVAILFGAEIMSKHEETLMFGALMSLLTVFPMTLHTGRQAVMKFVTDQPAPNMFHKLFYRTFQFTVAGAWAGAAFIPLDWDRPWQAWPITCSFGALIGNILGYLFILLQHFVFGAHGIFGKKKKSCTGKFQ